jgi:pimeloyl-ACP methyl ester carboxylesterase
MPDPPALRTGSLAVDGFAIRWDYIGEGAAPPVCLLNGLAMHTRAWYPFLDRLRPDYDVLLYDYPGQGDSTSSDRPVTMPLLADILARLADHLSLPPLHIVGVSYGGFVALEFARLYQERLRSMTLSGILLSREPLFEMYEALSLRFYRGGPAAFELYTHYMYEKIFGSAFVEATGPDMLEAMRVRFHERYAHRVHSLVRLTEAQDPFFAALDGFLPAYRAIRTPTLVMPGAEDRAIPLFMQRKICDVLPNAVWRPIDGSGHVVYLEKPDAFWPALTSFIDTHRQAPEARGT